MCLLACLWLAACGGERPAEVLQDVRAAPALYPGETPEVRRLVNKWADHYDVPRSLVHRVIQRESDYRAGARNGPSPPVGRRAGRLCPKGK